MKSLLSALVLGCANAVTPAPVAPAPAPVTPHATTPEELRSATVALLDEMKPFCGGVWVSPSQILTAKHCVDDERTVTIGIWSDLVRPDFEFVATSTATVVRVSEDYDLALLVSSARKHEFVHLAPGVADGETVYLVGHPNRVPFVFGVGVVDAVREMVGPAGEGLYVHVTSAAWFGSSGGGVFNVHGELIGVASFITKAPGQTFWSMPKGFI